MKRAFVLITFLLAIVLAVAGAITYIVTRPPALIDLKVTDGSTVGAIEGNLTAAGSNQTDLILDFAATTYANETPGAVSTLMLRLHTGTYYDSYGGDVVVEIYAVVVGAFASDLRPASLQLWANQTGGNGSLQSWADRQFGANVSFDPAQSFVVLNGTGTLSAIIGSASGNTFRFGYSDYFEVNGRPWFNRFVGFRVTVTGPFAPAVSVGILLKVINTNGGTWA